MAEKSFSELYRLHVNNIYYYLLSRVHNSADAETRLLRPSCSARKPPPAPPESSRPGFSIARNKANDYFRLCRKTDFGHEDDLTSALTRPQDRSSNKKGFSTSAPGFSAQSSEQDYLHLRLIAELPFAEIAQVMRQSEARSKNLITASGAPSSPDGVKMEQKTPFEERLQKNCSSLPLIRLLPSVHRRGSANAKASWAMPGGVSASAGHTR